MSAPPVGIHVKVDTGMSRLGLLPDEVPAFMSELKRLPGIAVEGISLTIANLTDDYFEIAMIPKTWEVTNFSQLKPGDEVNLEVDVIAKYVERILTTGNSDSSLRRASSGE